MRFAREHPEDWEERLEAMRDNADVMRKKAKEDALMTPSEPFLMIPGWGIWTVSGVKALLVSNQRMSKEANRRLAYQSEGELALRERERAQAMRDQEPGRWPDHASVQRMQRDIERDREEERYQ